MCTWDQSGLYPITSNGPQLTDHSLRTPINWLSKMCRINGLTTTVCESWSSGWRWGGPPPMPAHNTPPSFASSCGIATNLYPGHLRGLCFISLIWADSAKLLWGSALTANYRNLPRLLIENNRLRWASFARGNNCMDLYTFNLHLNMWKIVKCTECIRERTCLWCKNGRLSELTFLPKITRQLYSSLHV